MYVSMKNEVLHAHNLNRPEEDRYVHAPPSVFRASLRDHGSMATKEGARGCGRFFDRVAKTKTLVSECSKSEGPSLSTSPGSDFLTSPAHRSVPLTSRHFSRTSSRASQSSLQSPSKSTGTSPPKTGSSNSLNKFHNRLVDKLKRSLKKAEDCAEDQRNLS
ncbi:PREDICTED: uncharacterized protein LOC106740943 isoform X2 [Dinoponera quadriceps]|uniref:Uncharacterized protein LOC106740943 isoform X2 n=1 Tax=Dinoponera quadriceps TaxID=609295 RepID=A0A6P3WP48_DINQU|nr:PREDICTED: uncharacterized protein LOC106740943 isoform X2 [Dinoponera quadriceps]